MILHKIMSVFHEYAEDIVDLCIVSINPSNQGLISLKETRKVCIESDVYTSTFLCILVRLTMCTYIV